MISLMILTDTLVEAKIALSYFDECQEKHVEYVQQ